jgi:hypothetical protein
MSAASAAAWGVVEAGAATGLTWKAVTRTMVAGMAIALTSHPI